jgi:peptide/nickel transport system substrate-binding protein
MVLKRIANAALFVLLAAGCTKVHQGAGAQGPTDSFTFAQQWEPRSLNPALENGDSSQEWGLLLFSYLVRYGENGEIVPDVATEVPTTGNGGISRDGLTITYHLRRGVRFSDGVPLTARDAAWSVNAVNDPRNDVQSRFGYDDVARADAPNDTTLVLHLKHPFAPLISIVLAPQGFPIFPEHVLGNSDFNSGSFNSAPIGSGPYVVKRWIHNDRVILERDPFFWSTQPSIARITVLFVQSPQTAINMLLTHEIQGFFNDQDPADYPKLAAIHGYTVTREPPPDNGVGAIIFNVQDPLTSDARVRRALAEAIDVKTLVAKVYRGAESGAGAGRGLFLWAYDPKAFPDVRYDPDQARKLLDDAGWRVGPGGFRSKNGRSMNLLMIIQAGTPDNDAIGANVVQYERAIGVRVTLKSYNITQFVAPPDQGGPVYGGKFQLALYPFENGDDPDTTDQFACSNVPPNGFNKSRICEQQIDTLLARGRETYEASARRAIYANLQALLSREMPIVLLYQSRQVNTWTNRLHARGAGELGPFWNVANWYLSSS